MESQRPEINVVLFEPEIPQNTGNIARTCAATGSVLHLVGPLGFSIDEKHVRRAGLDYWPDVRIRTYDNIDGFMSENGDKKLWYFSTKGLHCYSDVDFKTEEVWLVFGKESAGIPEPILKASPDTCLRIPMLGETRSLNLSNSVAVAVYEVLRQSSFAGMKTAGQLHRLSW